MTDSFGDRMKQYEQSASQVLVRRTPIIIRVDGRSFHAFTKGCDRPFDSRLQNAFQQVAEALVKEVSGAVMAYGQSDEISILAVDYRDNQTEPWFGGKVQKISSVTASIATAVFNDKFPSAKPAMFDARVFNIPESDVPNYFYWRWKDAVRNSVSALAQSEFSHKELQGLNIQEQKRKLRYEANKPWEDLDLSFKDGWITHRSTLTRWFTEGVHKDIRDITETALDAYLRDFN